MIQLTLARIDVIEHPTELTAIIINEVLIKVTTGEGVQTDITIIETYCHCISSETTVDIGNR